MELIHEVLCVNTRKKVLKEFDSVVVAKRYMELYEEMIKLEKFS